MTAKSRANLKAAFETGDKPDGDDFADLIDSFFSLTDTSGQSVAGAMSVQSIVVNTLSAGTGYADLLYVRGLSTHQNPYIEAYADTTVQTSVDATAAWVPVSAALTAPNKSAFSVSGHDITYTGSVTANFVIEAQIEARGSANQNVWIAIAKNSAAISGSISKRRLGDAELAVHGTKTVVELVGNDIITMHVQTPAGPISALETFGVKFFIAPAYWS